MRREQRTVWKHCWEEVAFGFLRPVPSCTQMSRLLWALRLPNNRESGETEAGPVLTENGVIMPGERKKKKNSIVLFYFAACRLLGKSSGETLCMSCRDLSSPEHKVL